jgi:signal transduction histidine kinase
MLGLDYLKIAIQTPTPECIQEMAGILDEASEGCITALEFINNLLLYEKIDTMEMALCLKREDLREVCEHVTKSFQLSARQLEVSIRVDVDPSLESGAAAAFVEIDAHKIVVVLRNLMSNALKFTPKGGEVSLSLIPVHLASPSSGSMGATAAAAAPATRRSDVFLPPAAPPEVSTHIRLVLSDTGCGMSPHELVQLFTKIVQFSPNEIQKGGGSGIGLFLSHQIILGGRGGQGRTVLH